MPSDPAPRFSAPRRAIRRFIGQTWLSVFGWRVEGVTDLPPKAVLIAAPHTSNWDFPFTLAVSYVLDLEFSWLGKHTLFEPPFGWFFRWLDGIPVDRRDRNNLVAAVVDILKQRDELILVVAPEGTRSRTKRWKTGFYYVALGAGVPIILGYLDFPRKRGGILHVFYPTGDIEADMATIRRLYEGIEGKHPGRMSEITLGARSPQANGVAQHP
ncbi:lysophospholipid acyltransferase family protein, partial [Sorangium cellulosum]|uniref:lysophospholipid acyltransferase family protein n=1 Tax=unclassified Sorangium TaxID=2621164 RepID=UPI0007791E8F